MRWTFALEERQGPKEDPSKRLERTEIALQRCLKDRGPDAVPSTNYMFHVAEALERLGRFDDATALRRQVFNNCERYLGEEDHRTLNEGLRLACNLDATGHTKEAQQLAGHIRSVAAQAFGHDDAVTKAAALFESKGSADFRHSAQHYIQSVSSSLPPADPKSKDPGSQSNPGGAE